VTDIYRTVSESLRFLKQLESFREKLKKEEMTAEAARAPSPRKENESTVDFLKKLVPIILVAGVGFFLIGGFLSTEPIGNFTSTPALNIFTAIFSVMITISVILFFRKSS